MRPVTRRWARLGTRNSRTLRHPSDAGVCLSAFIIAKRGSKILVGKVRGTKDWPETGGYPRQGAIELEREGAWLLPATHLMMEEHPDEAAKRITRRWTGLRGVPKFVMVQSHTRPAGSGRKGAKHNHWDLCFVYELKVLSTPRSKPWWSELRFVSPSELRKLKLGRGHLDVLKEAEYV
jgi:ADP-ribose pyrophosphatase YjhB (NUDIX family)